MDPYASCVARHDKQYAAEMLFSHVMESYATAESGEPPAALLLPVIPVSGSKLVQVMEKFQKWLSKGRVSQSQVYKL